MPARLPQGPWSRCAPHLHQSLRPQPPPLKWLHLRCERGPQHPSCPNKAPKLLQNQSFVPQPGHFPSAGCASWRSRAVNTTVGEAHRGHFICAQTLEVRRWLSVQIMLQGLEKNGIRLKCLLSSLRICVVLIFHILTQTKWKWTLPLF